MPKPNVLKAAKESATKLLQANAEALSLEEYLKFLDWLAGEIETTKAEYADKDSQAKPEDEPDKKKKKRGN
jgi:hypothetical protein